MKNLLFIALSAVVIVAAWQYACRADDYFVAADGRPDNPGTMEDPWDIVTAFGHPDEVSPGDTIWLLGGVYQVQGALTSRLSGEPDNPIIVRQAQGERAIIDTGDSNRNRIQIGGAHTWYWGFEVMSSADDRVAAHTGEAARGMGVTASASREGTPPSPGLKFINMIVHDTQGGGGFSFWRFALEGEIYGCLIYYAGCNHWQHGIYTQNDEGVKRIVDNIIFANSGYGVHAYGSGAAYKNNFHVEGNIMFNNGLLNHRYTCNLLIGGGREAENPVVISNVSYFSPEIEEGSNSGGVAADIGYFNFGRGAKDAVVRDNYFIAPGGQALWLKADGAEVEGNTLYGALQGVDPEKFPENIYLNQRPEGTWVMLRPNAYEPGRAHIAVFNWDDLDSVAVDVSEVLEVGGGYEVRDGQNFFGPPVAQGVYDGEAIELPMNLMEAAEAIGGGEIGHEARLSPFRTPPRPSKEFNVFVLLPVEAE